MKPRRWIERLRLVRKDTYHQWLMSKYGLQEYVARRMWERELRDEPDKTGYVIWLTVNPA